MREKCNDGIDRITIVTPLETSKWLVLSSFFFTIPSGYAYYKKYYVFAILLLTTSFISANFWKNATYSFRRNLDLIFSKISLVVFIINGIIHVRYIPYVISGYSGLVLLLYCFHLSNKYYIVGDENWYKYHMIFHFIVMCEQLIVIDSIIL
jgi:hypothetical protein